MCGASFKAWVYHSTVKALNNRESKKSLLRWVFFFCLFVCFADGIFRFYVFLLASLPLKRSCSLTQSLLYIKVLDSLGTFLQPALKVGIWALKQLDFQLFNRSLFCTLGVRFVCLKMYSHIFVTSFLMLTRGHVSGTLSYSVRNVPKNSQLVH